MAAAALMPTLGVNEAPILDITKSPVLLETCAGIGPPVNGVSAGSPIALLVDGYQPADGVDNILDTDAAENETAFAQLGIALIGVGTGGTWFYTTNGCVTWSVVPAVSATSALLLAADAGTRIYFQATTGGAEVSIQFRAWDRTSGANGTLANSTINGGSTAFSVNTDVATCQVFGIRQVASVGSASGSTVFVPALATAQTGDVIVLVIVTSVGQPVTTAQFTTLIDQVQSTPTTSRLYVGWRVRTAPEPAYTVTLGAATAYAACAMALPWLETAGPGPVQANLAQPTPVGFAHTAPAVSPSVVPALLSTIHEFANSVTWTPPAGLTEALDRASSGSNALGVSMEVNQVFRMTTGTAGPFTAVAANTFPADAGAAATIAWRQRNSAPMLDNSRSPVLNDVAANAPPPIGPVGTLVSALIDPANSAGGLDNLHDLNGTVAHGIAITAAYVANGTWYFSLNNGASWSPLGIPSNSVARLLAADAFTRVYFQPAQDFSTNVPAALTYRAWDMTTGTSGGTANPSVNGGTTAFSFAKETASISFTPNLPPVNQVPGPLTTDEDLPLMLSSIDATAISITDPDAGGADIQVTLSVPTGAGALYMGNTFGVTLVAGAEGSASMTFAGPVSAMNPALDGLLFVPAADHNGVIPLTISTNDLGHFGGGGQLTDVDVVPITVLAINDPPLALVPPAQTTPMNTPLLFSAGDTNGIAITDVDIGTGMVQVSLTVSMGTITLGAPGGLDFSQGDGIEDTAMTFMAGITAANSSIAEIMFTPALDLGGPAVFSISVDDLGGSGAGGAWLTTGTVDIQITTTFVTVSPRMVLEGPYNSSSGLMSDALRVAGLLPLTEPYSSLGYSHVGGGGEVTSGQVLSVGGNNGIVDWVVLEARSIFDPVLVVASRSALLQRDGDVVGPDGLSPVELPLSAGYYYLAVRHRNHLGVMTDAPISLNVPPLVVDFTTGSSATFGSDARRSIPGAFSALALWTGDVNLTKEVKYTGTGNDRDPILVAVGNSTPNNTVIGQYSVNDLNLDGMVKYTGTANDRDRVLQAVGSSTPNNARQEQLP